MSIVRMRKIFRRKIGLTVGKKRINIGSPMEIVFWGIVVIFIVGAYQYFGGPTGGPSAAEREQAQRKVTKNIAIVNGQVITRAEFEAAYLQRASDLPTAELVTYDRNLKSGLLDGMIHRLLLLDAAKKEGVKVSRPDIAAKADEMAKQEMDARYPTRRAMAKMLKKEGKTAEQVRAEIRRKILQDRKRVMEAVLFERLEETIKSRVQVSDAELEDSYAQIRVRHILISPDELRRKDEEAKEKEKASEAGGQAKSAGPEKDYKALAKQRAEELLARVKKGEDFAALAKQYSHDFASAEAGGMLHSRRPPASGNEKPSEWVGRNEMVPEFDKAAFALKPGEISGVVETDYGFHIIQVLERRVELPKDFKEKKEQYRAQLLEQRKAQAWAEYVEGLKKAANIVMEDPELAAYRALDEGRKEEALPLLTKAVESDPTNVGAKYQLAMLLKGMGQKQQALVYLQQLAETDRASACPQVHLELARIYLEQKKTKEAVEAFKAASEWAQNYDYQNMYWHQEVRAELEKLGEKDLVAQEDQWLAEFYKQQRENPSGMGLPLNIVPQGSG